MYSLVGWVVGQDGLLTRGQNVAIGKKIETWMNTFEGPLDISGSLLLKVVFKSLALLLKVSFIEGSKL